MRILGKAVDSMLKQLFLNNSENSEPYSSSGDLNMNKKLVVIVAVSVCFFSLVLGGCATSKGEGGTRVDYDFGAVEKIAIVEVSGAIAGDAAKNQISDFFAMELLKKGFTPVERAQVQTLMVEQQFQTSDFASTQGAARVGNILNVPAVMLINIPKYEDKMNMTAKIIRVEDGGILWIGSGFGSTGKTLSTVFGAMIGGGTGVAVAGDDTSDKVVAGVAGGVLGGLAGRALTPQQADQAQKIVKKMCESLPSRIVGQVGN